MLENAVIQSVESEAPPPRARDQEGSGEPHESCPRLGQRSGGERDGEGSEKR
jgi:hypothetical protein